MFWLSLIKLSLRPALFYDFEANVFYVVFLVTWYKVIDGQLEKVDDKSKYHIEDYETTYCMEVKNTQEVDAGIFRVVAENEAGDIEADFTVNVQSKF